MSENKTNQFRSVEEPAGKQRGGQKKTRPIYQILTATLNHNPGVAAALVLSVAAEAVLTVLPPLALARAVDLLTGEGSGRLPVLAILYFALTAAANAAAVGREILITVFGQKMTHEMRSALKRKLSRLPASYFIDQESGATTALFTNDVNACETLFSSGVISMVADACTIVAILVVVFRMSKGLFLLLLAALPILFRFTRVIQRRMLRAQWDNRVAVAKTNQQIPETVANLRTIRLLRVSGWRERQYDACVREGFQAMERSNLCDSVYSPVIMTVKALLVAIMMILAVRVSGSSEFFGMNAGSVVALIAYIGKIFTPLESIGMEIQSIQEAAAGIGRIEEFLRLPERQPQSREIEANVDEGSAPLISFSHVTFGYEPGVTVLKDFNLDVRRGETVTLEGRTGIGKTTCFRLLLGLYKPWSGEVRIAGRDVYEQEEADRRSRIACVEQNFHAVPGSVRDQITLYDQSVTDEMIRKTLALTGLEHACGQLPEGLQTPFTESLFSEGQKQLLSIARAIVCDPDILLLDEITANLDSVTEAEVLAALRNASQNRTVLSISHRTFMQESGKRVCPGR
jgi:ATP-binding cassette subfamily B multidrug efflux pump